MNTFIESLNRWGAQSLQFAGPMLWQSSLLIVALFALDFALRKKLRPTIRCALWLVVLVKLLLPPTLALPTSFAWWLRPAAPAANPPQPQMTVVTSPDSPTPALAWTLRPVSAPLPPRASAPLPVSAPAGMLVLWSSIGFGLLVWLVIRWRQVARDVKQSSAAPARLNEILDQVRRSLGMRRAVRLRLTDRAMSPAVCGLFRPVILLSRSLADRLSAEQLRAVLLHELIHLRRGDVRVNCCQALLQIVYWWHPLLWLANARLRRLREEAVDDAVMLALREEADAYAPTLVEVARHAFRRPLASLGLVGILESRRALRQRIERLVNFKPPGRAGLSIASILGIAAFTALAVPMGKAPAKPEPRKPAAMAADEAFANYFGSNGVHEVQKAMDLLNRLTADARTDGSPPANSTDGSRNPAPGNSDSLIRTSNRRQIILRKLSRIRIDHFASDSLPLNEVIRKLHEQVDAVDVEKPDLNFLIQPPRPAVGSLDPATGLPVSFTNSVADDLDINRVTVRLELNNVRLADLLDAIVASADHPIKYAILDYGIVFLPKEKETSPFLTRRFKADPIALRQAIERFGPLPTDTAVAGKESPVPVPRVHIGGDSSNLEFEFRTNELHAMQTTMMSFFDSMGVDMRPQTGKSVFYKDRDGMLLVRASEADLQRIEAALQQLNSPPSATGPASPDKTVSTADESLRACTFAFSVPDFRRQTGLAERSTAAEFTEAFRKYLSDAGVSLQRPTSFYVDESTGRLVVRATDRELAAIYRVIQSLNRDAGKIDINAMVQNSRLLFEQGRLEEAEDVLRQASVLEPGNASVRYYLDLVRDARSRKPGPKPAAAVAPADASADLKIRKFNVDPNTVYQALQNAGVLRLDKEGRVIEAQDGSSVAASPNPMSSVTTAVRKFFGMRGVDLEPPRSVFFNDRNGSLLVRASAKDMDFIEALVQTLNTAPAQILVKAKFIEAPEPVVNALLAKEFASVSANPAFTATLLAPEEARKLLRELQSQDGVDVLNESQVTTHSGRQAQIQIADTQYFVIGITNGIAQTQQVPLGPTLDVIPYLSPDGLSIQMTVIPSIIELLGYDEPGKAAPDPSPRPLPRFRITQTAASINVPDGQTLVLGNLTSADIVLNNGQAQTNAVPENLKRQLLIFVTPCAVDAAGNLVHRNETTPVLNDKLRVEDQRLGSR